MVNSKFANVGVYVLSLRGDGRMSNLTYVTLVDENNSYDPK